MADKTNANIGFEKELWDAACVLWGHIPAAEYRNIIIGLIFLRYISCAFEECQKKIVQALRDEGETDEEYIRSELEVRDNYLEHSVFFVPQVSRWSCIAEKSSDPGIGKVIDNAMKAIEDENPSLKGVLPKHYANGELDKTVLGKVVDIFTNIDMREHGSSKDLLGRTYEYCLAKFAEKEGKGGGEFYTPESIVKTLVAILKPFENCRVYNEAVA